MRRVLRPLLKRNTQLLYCLHCYRFDPSSICSLVVVIPHLPLTLSHAPASWVNSIVPHLVTRNQQVHSAMWFRVSYLHRPEYKSSLGTFFRVHILRSLDRFVTLSPLARYEAAQPLDPIHLVLPLLQVCLTLVSFLLHALRAMLDSQHLSPLWICPDRCVAFYPRFTSRWRLHGFSFTISESSLSHAVQALNGNVWQY